MTMMEKISEFVISKFIDVVLERVQKRWGAREPGIAVLEVKDPRGVLRAHLRMVNRWASEISFRDLRKAKRLKETYVDLDLDLGRAASSPVKLPGGGLKISDIALLRENLVLLGDPGAGKTTSLKRIALQFLASGTTDRVLPLLLVQLRDFPESDSLAENILSTLGIVAQADSEFDSDKQRRLLQRFTLKHVDEAEMTVLIDGLDEISATVREGVVADLRYFLLNSERSGAKFILTCRTGDFRYHLDNSAILTILPLNDSQITEFAERWLGIEKATDFISQIRANPYSGSEVRPLTLAHLCAIFERSGRVPEKPRTVYRKVVRLLLEEWDEQRSIRRASRYGNFDVDRKEEFLQAIAFRLTLRGARGRFSHNLLQSAYHDVYSTFDLPPSDAAKVVREIESHTGLVLESSDDAYEFAHKSLQEYLTAAYALRLPQVPFDLLGEHPNELALAVALSADPNGYFGTVVDYWLASSSKAELAALAEPFLRRLSVEKVDFTPHRALGECVIRLVSSAYQRESIRRISRDRETELFLAPPDPEAVLDFLREPAIARSVEEVLKSAAIVRTRDDSFRVTIASLGEEAAAQTLHPDIILAVDDTQSLAWLRNKLDQRNRANRS
jgi:hypothetical protein